MVLEIKNTTETQETNLPVFNEVPEVAAEPLLQRNTTRRGLLRFWEPTTSQPIAEVGYAPTDILEGPSSPTFLDNLADRLKSFKLGRRPLLKTAAAMTLLLTLPEILVSCAPEKTPQDMAAEKMVDPVIDLYETALEYSNIRNENPDRAVVAALAAYNRQDQENGRTNVNEERLKKILTDYDYARSLTNGQINVPADQAMLLAAAANTNENGRDIKYALSAHNVLFNSAEISQDLPDIQDPKRHQISAGLANIHMVLNSDLDEVRRRYAQFRSYRFTQEEALSMVHDSYFLGGVVSTADAYQKIVAHPGITRTNAVLLVSAAALSGAGAEGVLEEYQTIKENLNDDTSDEVVTDMVVAGSADKQKDRERTVYVYNYGGGGGGGTIDSCRSLRLTQGAIGHSNQYAAMNSYTQNLMRGGMHHSNFAPASFKPGSMYVSGRSGGTGSGTAVTSRGGYTMGSSRGGFSIGGGRGGGGGG